MSSDADEDGADEAGFPLLARIRLPDPGSVLQAASASSSEPKSFLSALSNAQSRSAKQSSSNVGKGSYRLSRNSCCPTMDVIALMCASEEQDRSLEVVSLYRGSGKVWDWHDPELPSERIHTDLVWSPDGRTLAYVVTTRQSVKVQLLSVHDAAIQSITTIENTGEIPSEQTALPIWFSLSKSSNIKRGLAWSTFEESLYRLPVPACHTDNVKEPVSFAPLVSQEQSRFFKPAERDVSILALPHADAITATLLLDGRHSLGNVALRAGPSSVTSRCVEYLPTPNELVTIASTGSISRILLDLPYDGILPLMRTCEDVQEWLRTAKSAIQPAVDRWREHTQLGYEWLTQLNGRIASESQSDTSAEQYSACTQIYTLLATGKCTPAVTEYLGTKLTERLLDKWEHKAKDAIASTLLASRQIVAPLMERVIMRVDHALACSVSGRHWTQFQLHQEELERCRNMALFCFTAAYRVHKLSLIEQRRTLHFFSFLRFEMQMLAQDATETEASVSANHDALEASRFIRSTLSTVSKQSDETSGSAHDHELARYLNDDVKAGEEEELSQYIDPSNTKARASAELERMRQAYRGLLTSRTISAPMQAKALPIYPLAIALDSLEASLVACLKRGMQQSTSSLRVVSAATSSARAVRLQDQHVTASSDLVIATASDKVVEVVCYDGLGMLTTSDAKSINFDAPLQSILALRIFDASDLIMLSETMTDGKLRHMLSMLSYDNDGRAPRHQSLDSMPEDIALNGRAGRKVAGLLCERGRSLELLDLSFDDEVEEDDDLIMSDNHD
ncbi:uncharacterized protein L969DRAFT_616402 [Mixia osmundae IAM 14324]|uniref:Uncharacterized protein n=1 Tax=Mixia osmundae (strain CBS 9802 / IAM 14324 / JCM 22182 / KY 12970) TaxID=764103 RepID=G7E6C2_MIXOS|nr:uncharacterized protein L969DRAFT_616402 [Mixia osmundae IAM 14324]KEI40461.1 hypothetical protein L969DRAFT_616402 [Mixia osmundae IAM 14324]GAA98382.1 hypothetical protein E5Q_05068 [Mixia osmundae IAM 14324]